VDDLLTPLADPNLAYILFAVGLLAVLVEMHSPNLVTGIAGAVAIVLAILGFSRLPIDIAGVLLIVAAVVLFVLELNVASHGLLGLAGVALLALGGLMLVHGSTATGEPVAGVAIPVIVAMSVIGAVVVAGLSWLAVRSRTEPVIDLHVAGDGGRILATGTRGRARTVLAPEGVIAAGEERWTARSADGSTVSAGTNVRVVGAEGLTILVEPVTADGGRTDARATEP
jgi:membrane-bound serine protease (ClpP class)